MRFWDVSRYALTSSAAFVLLAACGGPQPPIDAENPPPQGRAIVADRGGSWILPEAKNGDLIYAEGGACGGACILSYPSGKHVGAIAFPYPSGGACSDAQGNVFLTEGSEVTEFAHGGTTPIASFMLPGSEANACGVDPATGNLAVTFSGTDANIAVFSNSSKSPSLYIVQMLAYGCGYDDAGNLFVSGLSGQNPGVAELARGASEFNILLVSPQLGAEGQIQWDGKYITFQSRSSRHIKISRLTVIGSTVKIVGQTNILRPANANETWITGNRVIVPYSTRGQLINRIGLWQYPKSGKVVAKLGTFGSGPLRINGVTVSVIPSPKWSGKEPR